MIKKRVNGNYKFHIKIYGRYDTASMTVEQLKTLI